MEVSWEFAVFRRPHLPDRGEGNEVGRAIVADAAGLRPAGLLAL